MSFLAHHGIKGQKWGVRRFQNADGTLTEAGKKHALEQRRIQATSKTNDKVTDIIKSMTSDDLYNLGYSKEEIARGDPAVQLAGPDAGKSVAKRFIVEYGDKPVSFLDLEEFVVDGEKILNAVIGTRSGEEYRGKGFASQAVKEATDWFDKNADRYDYTEINWGARSTNEASKKLAEKSGFESRGSSEEGWDDYAYRRKRVKHTDIKEEPLMDMSYEDFLEHHGIKGQKWGVRKYQNDDGSLTSAGRVRYGVGKARDAAVATVKKVASATGTAAKKVAVATGHGVAKVGKTTANKVGEVHAARKAEKREKKIREWSTDLEELNKHQTELTDDEFREALARANMNKQLSELKKAELDRGLSYLKSAANAAGDTLLLANNVSKMITGKSFEDLRKAPSEKDRLDLEIKRSAVTAQEAITAKKIAEQKEQEAKARKAENDELANRWKDLDTAADAERTYKTHQEQRAAIDEAMRKVREHEAQVEANRKAGAEKAQRTKEENEYHREVRSTNEYQQIYDRVEQSQKQKLVNDYKKNYGVSAKEADKMADAAVERLADWYFDREMSLSVFDDPNYLEHHGIKGQKWGVRRFQDYDGHRIGASKAVAYDPKTANTTDHHANDNETQRKADIIRNAVTSAGLLAFGVATTGVVLATTGFIALPGVMTAATGALGLGTSAADLVKVKLADVKVKKLDAEREANTNVDKKTGLKLKSSEMSEKEDLKRVNPGFNNWNTNTKSNCMLCTTAYDMRRRGFDVQAKTASVGYNYDDVNVWYPKAKVMKIEHKKTLMDELGYTHTLTRDTKKILAAQGDGARGNIMVHWDMDHGGGGHSMVYEVQKGKVIIRCPQSNRTWKDASILDSCMSVSYARLDNVDFDPKKIKEAVE